MNSRKPHHPEESMEIGFIGAIAIASALAGADQVAGYPVTLSNRRGPDSLTDQAAALDRAHQSRDQRPPLHDPDQPIDVTAVIKRRTTVAGLIHEYRRAA